MSSQAVIDYLTKQIFIEKNIVTYRSVSRALRIHVNIAKNELATYHAIAPYQSQTSMATYLLSGEVLAPQTRGRESDTEDVDMDKELNSGEEDDSEYDGDDVPQTKMVLVNERDLENVVSQFQRLNSIHVYSLAPAAIHDAGLLCEPTESVRAADGSGGDIASVVGKVVGENIKTIKAPKAKPAHAPVAGPSKLKATSVIPVSKPPEKTKYIPDELEDAKNNKPKEATKATGKLDFSKSKTKEMKREEAKTEQKRKEVTKMFFAPAPPKGGGDAMSEENPKKGKKRKSPMAMSDAEDGEPSTAPLKTFMSTGNVRVKKRTVLSDDDDDHGVDLPPRRTRKSFKLTDTRDSDEEKNVRALMDMDDDQVTRASREAKEYLKEEEEEESEHDVDQDVEMADIPVLKAKPKKRREKKKVIPLGRNGLKKKRVIKSRQTLDAKGYTVTEDYSSYESVEEEEESESITPAKPKVKAKPKPKVKKESGDESTTINVTPKLKPTANSSTKDAPKAKKSKVAQPKQKSLANFFAPPKAKK